MIEVENLSKRYGDKLAVDAVSFVVQPGMVTGFLDPNGAGKSTPMRMIAGLDEPTAGRVTVNGAATGPPGRQWPSSGCCSNPRRCTPDDRRNHLLALAQTNGISSQRVDQVIDLVGLHAVAGTRAGGFSLGMGQRLGVASALLGTRRPLRWTSQPTASIPKACCGCAPCSRSSPQTATPCSCSRI